MSPPRGRCPQGYEWLPTNDGGYVCAGGHHSINSRGEDGVEEVRRERRDLDRSQSRAKSRYEAHQLEQKYLEMYWVRQFNRFDVADAAEDAHAAELIADLDLPHRSEYERQYYQGKIDEMWREREYRKQERRTAAFALKVDYPPHPEAGVPRAHSTRSSSTYSFVPRTTGPSSVTALADAAADREALRSVAKRTCGTKETLPTNVDWEKERREARARIQSVLDAPEAERPVSSNSKPLPQSSSKHSSRSVTPRSATPPPAPRTTPVAPEESAEEYERRRARERQATQSSKRSRSASRGAAPRTEGRSTTQPPQQHASLSRSNSARNTTSRTAGTSEPPPDFDFVKEREEALARQRKVHNAPEAPRPAAASKPSSQPSTKPTASTSKIPSQPASKPTTSRPAPTFAPGLSAEQYEKEREKLKAISGAMVVRNPSSRQPVESTFDREKERQKVFDAQGDSERAEARRRLAAVHNAPPSKPADSATTEKGFSNNSPTCHAESSHHSRSSGRRAIESAPQSLSSHRYSTRHAIEPAPQTSSSSRSRSRHAKTPLALPAPDDESSLRFSKLNLGRKSKSKEREPELVGVQRGREKNEREKMPWEN